MHEHTAEY